MAATTCSLQDVHRERPRRALGHQPGQQPAGVHEVPLPGPRSAARRVVVVNPYLEPGLERYWVPSNVESALFGTKMCDLHVPVRPGGDVAFANAALKRLIERGDVDEAFVAAHTEGWDELVADARRASRSTTCWPRPASTPAQLEAFVDLYAAAGVGHPDVVDGHHPAPPRGRRRAGASSTSAWPAATSAATAPGSCRSAATRACRAAPRWARTPPRSPAASTIDDAHAARAGRRSGASRCPATPGCTAPEMVEAAERGELDVLWIVGRQLPRRAARPAAGRGRARAGAAAGAPGHRRVSSQMLVPGDDVILLPVRHPLRAGGRRHRDHHRAPRSCSRPRSPARSARPAASGGCSPTSPPRVRPELGDAFAWADNQALRAEIAEVVPALRRHRDAGRPPATPSSGAVATCAPGGVFPTPSGRGRFIALVPARARPARGHVHRGHPAGQAVQLDGAGPRPTRSPAPAATRSTSTRPTPPRSGLADGDRGARCAPTPARWHGPPAVRAPARAHAAGALARGQRADRRPARSTASPARRCPTTTPSSPSMPRG